MCRLWPVHRADLQQVLSEAAIKQGVTLRLGCLVVAVDEGDQALSVVVHGGERLFADMVVGADGKPRLSSFQVVLIIPSWCCLV